MQLIDWSTAPVHLVYVILGGYISVNVTLGGVTWGVSNLGGVNMNIRNITKKFILNVF